MKKFILSLTFFGSIFISSGLMAQLPSVAIVASDNLPSMQDVQSKLQSTGFFELVDIIDVNSATPSLATLQNYDAILAYTQFSPFDPTTLGNNLALYIENGGGVVAATFFNIDPWQISGSFESNYSLLSTTTTSLNGSQLTMVINDGSHPVMTDVSLFDGGVSSFHSGSSTVLNGGNVVASWTDDEPLVIVAENIGPSFVRRVDLNFYLTSSDINGSYWDTSTDGDIIMGNSLLWVAGYDRPGNQKTLTFSSGTITDGSNIYDYINNESASWLISPAGAQSITLDFTSMDTESCCDIITVYDGSDNMASILGTFGGTTIPTSVTSSGGNMFIEFTSDGSITQSGWAANYTITFDLPTTDDLVGDWVMVPEADAFYVGPSPGSSEYFSNDVGSVSIRSCFFDDVYKFGTGGDYSIEMDNETWLEAWQGSIPDDCGVPVAPHDGIGPYTYSVSGNSLTLSGFGAFMGLAKTYNGDELPSGSVPSSITYDIVQFDDQDLPKTLSLQIEIGGGVYWTFRFQSVENLTGSYPFSGNANDVSGLGNDLTEFEPVLANDRFTNSNSAYSFDGIDDYMSVSSEIIPSSGDFSVSVWAKSTGPTNIFTHILSQNDDGANNFYLGQSDLGTIRVGDNWGNTGASFPSDGQWHHFVVTKDDLNTIVYLDNIPVASLGSAIPNPVTVSPEFRVGRQYGGIGEYFEGSIDDIKIFDITLNSTEINDLYSEGGWPTVPAIPTFESYATSSSSIDLEWGDVEEETGYIIERSLDDVSYFLIATPSANETTFTDNGLAENTLAYYRIRSENAQGQSDNGTTENASYSSNLTTNFNYNDVYGGVGSDYTEGIAADTDGNYYLFGRYNDQIEFKSNFLSSSNPINQNSLFLTKFDVDGNVFWARDVTSDDIVVPRDVTVADDNSVYITGYFWGNLTFAGNTITSTSGTASLYLLKYDANGNEIWSRTVSSPSFTVSNKVDTDSQGNIYLAGYIPDEGVTFGGTTVTTKGGAMFKFDQNGNELLLTHAPTNTTGTGVTEFVSIEVVSDGFYLTGDQFATTDYGNGITSTSGDEGDLFVAKYDLNGNAQWVQTHGGTDYDVGRDITVDISGNVYVTGYFRSAGFIDLVNNGTGNIDIVVLKYDSDGNLLWNRGAGNFPNDIPYSIATDGVNAYVTGYKSKRPVSFEGISVDNGSMFLAKYLPDGSVEWVEKMEGEIWGYELDYHNGNLYLAGNFDYDANFGSFSTSSNNRSRDIHTATISVGTPIVAHWPITAVDGGNDITGNGNDLDDESSGLGSSGTDRFIATSETFEFNGTNYAVARSTNHPTGNFSGTYSFWEFHSVSHQGKFISVGQNLATDASAIRVNFNQYQYQNGMDVITFSPTVEMNRWNHVVLVREGDNVTLWLNGQQYETATMISQGLATTDIFVGQTGEGSEFFQGEMDDIRIYNYAISASEVQSLFDEGVDTSIPLVQLDPSLVTADDGVRLIYNAERGNKALMGLDDDDIYLFSGVLTSDVPTYYQPWEFLATSDFFDNSVGLMTRVSGTPNQWEINLGPSIRDYYSVPTGTPIYQLAMVFRDSNGVRVGKGGPDYGAFPGGFVTDGSDGTTPGDIYVEVANASTELELDELALTAFYNSTNGDFWTDNTNWLTGSIDTWYGVTVSGGRVVDVYLDNNNLSGTLPSAIGQLDACTSFSITGNNVSGDIPATIGNMASLQYLYLDNNSFTGAIPGEIGNLSNLMDLYLNENDLSGLIPTSLGTLGNLQYLSLYDNQLSGSLPSSFSGLASLIVLDLGDNDLSGLILTSLGTLTNLSEIWLGNNSFSGSIPSELGNIPNLTQLYLYSNDLSGSIPLELGNLTNLIALDLYENNLSGYIPEEIGNLSNLIAISFNDNNLTGGLPNGFGSMSSLVYLDIGYNQLENIPNLSGTALTDLYIASNKFTMEDILLNLGVASITYDYNPQELVGDPQNRFISNGTVYTFDLGFDSGVGGSVYSWYRDDILYTTTFVNSLDFSPISLSDAGNWFVEITNSSLPDLILRTEDIYLNVEDICISAASNSADTRIERVVFNDLDNSSPDECSTYTNYTNLSATVFPGQNIEVGFVLGTCGIQAPRTAVVLVDWNQSGDFQLPEEMVAFLDDPSFNNAYLSASIDIPTDVAVDENYLIRVVTIQDESNYLNITGCESYSFGETEDYTLNVIDGAADLAIQLVDAKPNTMFQPLVGVNANSDIQVTTNVTNTGLANVDLTRGIGYFLSTDEIISGDDLELGTIPISNLTNGNIFTDEDVIVNIPGSTPQGSYYLIVVADPDQITGDPDLSDNYSASPLVYIFPSLDSEDPVISLQSPPSSHLLGSGSETVSASITDNLGIGSVNFYWGRISDITNDNDEAQYNLVNPEESTTGIYEYTFQDSDFSDDLGVQYFFRAFDAVGNSAESSPNPATISVEFPDGSVNLSDVSPISNSSEPSETDYRIFSVPVRSTTVADVLGSPEVDKGAWRVWRYSGSNSELTSSSSLSAGSGYWLIYQSSSGLSFDFGGEAVNTTSSSPFTLNLSSGINLIGNPYNFTISWQEVIDHNVTQGIIGSNDVSGLTFYRGGFNSVGNANLEVTHGAFVQSNENFALEIPISSNAFARTGINARNSANGLDQDKWEVGIDLANDITFYNVAAVGMNPEALVGKDKFDQMAMPFLFRYLEFNSENDQFEERFSKDIVKTSENYVWEFEASTSFDPSKATLSWDNSYFGDNDQQLYLYDLKEERIINMREQTEYHFFLRGKQSFKILYGSVEFIESTLKPTDFTLGHAYPNPFADVTRIPFSLSDEYELYKVRLMVYNSIGELVKVLSEDDYKSGFYAADWDGTNEFGQEVSEGIYIYKLRITHENGSNELTGKLIYGK